MCLQFRNFGYALQVQVSRHAALGRGRGHAFEFSCFGSGWNRRMRPGAEATPARRRERRKIEHPKNQKSGTLENNPPNPYRPTSDATESEPNSLQSC